MIGGGAAKLKGALQSQYGTGFGSQICVVALRGNEDLPHRDLRGQEKRENQKPV
jgi:hypothetical protein